MQLADAMIADMRRAARELGGLAAALGADAVLHSAAEFLPVIGRFRAHPRNHGGGAVPA